MAGSAAWLRTGERKGRIVAVLALAYALYALTGVGGEALLWGATLLALGLPLYAVRRRYSPSIGS